MLWLVWELLLDLLWELLLDELLLLERLLRWLVWEMLLLGELLWHVELHLRRWGQLGAELVEEG